MKLKVVVYNYKGYEIEIQLKEDGLWYTSVYKDKILKDTVVNNHKKIAKQKAQDFIDSLEESKDNRVIINGDVYGYKDFVNKITNNLDEDENIKKCPYCCEVVTDKICSKNKYRCRQDL